jgi:MSHA biogenesis protein MshP
MSTARPDRCSGGFAIVSAIFILVVLATLAGFIVSVTTTQNLTFAQDVQGVRAYQAARAGTEWGIYQWLNGYSCVDGASTDLTFTDADLSGFTTTVKTTRNVTSGALATATGTVGTNTLTVASATGISVGMEAKGTGIASDATVSSIVGTTITLSANHTAAVSGNVSFGVIFCDILATARPTGATAGSLAFVERQMRVLLEN